MSKKSLPLNGVTIPVNPMALTQAVQKIFESYNELQTVREQEQTKREDITARRDAVIENIRANRDVMLAYLKGEFDKQGAALDGLFRGLDAALAANNSDLVGQILGGIVETVKTSPLGDLQTLDKRMQDDSFKFVLGKG